jgi:hypothetical protein
MPAQGDERWFVHGSQNLRPAYLTSFAESRPGVYFGLSARPPGQRRFLFRILPLQRSLHHLREFAHDLDLDCVALGRG